MSRNLPVLHAAFGPSTFLAFRWTTRDTRRVRHASSHASGHFTLKTRGNSGAESGISVSCEAASRGLTATSGGATSDIGRSRTLLSGWNALRHTGVKQSKNLTSFLVLDCTHPIERIRTPKARFGGLCFCLASIGELGGGFNSRGAENARGFYSFLKNFLHCGFFCRLPLPYHEFNNLIFVF